MPFDADYIRDPYAAMARLRDDGPVHQVTTPDGRPLWLVTRFSLAAANHDPARFESPDTFVPERRDRGHLTFGNGIHHCLGAPLARLEGRIAIDSALRRYPAMALADPAELAWRPSIRSHGLRSLPVRLSTVRG
jgi:cytochrome P450